MNPSTPSDNPEALARLNRLIGIIFASFFFLTALVFLAAVPMKSLYWVLMGAVCLPPVGQQLRRVMREDQAGALRMVIVIVCFIAQWRVPSAEEQARDQAQAMNDRRLASIGERDPSDLGKRAVEEVEQDRAVKALAEGRFSLKGGYLIAVSEDVMDKAITYGVQKDEAALQQLIASGLLMPTRPGMKVRLMDAGGLSGKVKIRPEGQTKEGWIVREALVLH